MTDDRSLERAARSWLEEGPTRAPDRAVDAALSRIQTIRQERGPRLPWRFPTMNRLARIGVLAVALGVPGAVALLVVGGPPAPLATPTVAPPSQPAASSPAADPCGHQLIPTMLMTAGCTYAATDFVHPFTITADGDWLVGSIGPSFAIFRGYSAAAQSASVEIIQLGWVDDLGCPPSASPPDPNGAPLSAGAYVSLLRAAVPGVSEPEDSTFGGLPAVRLSVPSMSECLGHTLGWSAVAPDGSGAPLTCFGTCSLYVLEDQGKLLLATVAWPSPPFDGEAPAAAARFIEALKFSN